MAAFLPYWFVQEFDGTKADALRAAVRGFLEKPERYKPNHKDRSARGCIQCHGDVTGEHQMALWDWSDTWEVPVTWLLRAYIRVAYDKPQA